jgi:propionyl-CoA carboxylase beta chain
MGPEGAVNIVHRAALQNAEDPKATRDRFVKEYKERFASPFKAAELGFVDEVLDPAELRLRLHQSLSVLATKRQKLPPKKHGNLPL